MKAGQSDTILISGVLSITVFLYLLVRTENEHQGLYVEFTRKRSQDLQSSDSMVNNEERCQRTCTDDTLTSIYIVPIGEMVYTKVRKEASYDLLCGGRQ